MGCCLTVVLIFLAIAVAFIYVAAALIILDIVFFFMVMSSAIRRDNAKNMSPSKMICPNCESTYVKLSTRKSGSTTNTFYYRFGASWNKSIHYQRVAECKDCGYTWDYITREDILNEQSRANAGLVVSAILFALCAFATIRLLG